MKNTSLILLLLVSLFSQLKAQEEDNGHQSLEQKAFLALDNKDFDGCKSLINQGADVNALYDGSKYSGSKGWSLFIFAMVVSDDVDFMRYLMSKGANPKLKVSTDQDKNAMHFAANNNMKDMMTFLIDEAGLSIDNPDKYGKTPLFYACMADYPKKEVIQFMINKGAKPNHRSSDGTTALNYAIGYEALSLVKTLVENGADVNNQSTYGSPYNRFQVTTLGTAISYRNVAIFNYLLSKGADYTYEGMKTTPLHLAASWGFPYAINKLLALGLDKTKKDLDGKTALNIAVEKDKKLAQQLLLYGPSENDRKLFRLMEDPTLADIKIGMSSKVEGKVNIFDLEGNQVNIKKYQNKLSLINFWATWCGPCVREMPSMKNLQEKMGNKLQILAISVDEDRSKVPEFDANRGPFPFTYLHDPKWAFYKEMWSSLPGSYLVNKEGVILASVSGSYKWDDPKVIELIEVLSQY